jgi:hypothetical protein
VTLASLYDHRSEPDTRAVLEDALEERGANLRWMCAVIGNRAAADAAAADAAADADADANHKRNSFLRGTSDMRAGLKIVVTPGNYWCLSQIGWLRRVEGDEWELVGARTLRRIGEQVPLAEIAAKGPGKTIKLMPVAEQPEEIHRLLIRRSIPANEAAWAEHCPKPDDWKDEP